MHDRELIENFLTKLYADNKSNNTIENYRIDLNHFLEYLETRNLTITNVKLKDLEAYKAYLRNVKNKNGKTYSETTRARKISALKSFYKYLYDHELIDKNPALKLTVPKIGTGEKAVFMTPDDAKKLLEATKGEEYELRDKTIIKLFLITGMRLSELANLNIDDIQGTQIIIRKGKGNKTRTVDIDEPTAKLIKRYLDNRKCTDTDALFISKRGKRMSVRTIQWTIDKYIDKAGLDKRFSTHSLRHCFATTLVSSNQVNLNTIRDILGHASIRTTQRYMHVLKEDKQQAANVVGKILGI